MERRVIPTLLLRNRDFVKSFGFGSHQYLGDPLNIVKLLNEKFIDEFIIFDITNAVLPAFKYLEDLVSEASIPVTYGGNIRNLSDAKKLIRLGIERLSLSSAKYYDDPLLERLIDELGSSSISSVLDVSKYCNPQRHILSINAVARHIEHCIVKGVSEVIIQDLDSDGYQQGLNQHILKIASNYKDDISIVVGCGARTPADYEFINEFGLGGLSASSLFVFAPGSTSVLINNPFVNYEEIRNVFRMQ